MIRAAILICLSARLPTVAVLDKAKARLKSLSATRWPPGSPDTSDA